MGLDLQFRGRRLGVIAALLLLCPLAACSTGGSHKADNQFRSVDLTAIDQVSVPSGYGTPEDLTPDPMTPGLWFLDASESDISIFFWNASTKVLLRNSLGSPNGLGLTLGDVSALAVAPSDGTVWVGIDSELFSLTVAGGQVSSVMVPAPSDNQAAEQSRPPQLVGTHQIQDLAVSSAGNVAIAMAASNSVDFYNVSSGTFSQSLLPPSDEPTKLAYLPNGSLGVATNDWNDGAGSLDHVDVISPSNSVIQIQADSGALAVSGDQLISYSGSEPQIDVTDIGNAQASSVAPNPTTTPEATAVSFSTGSARQAEAQDIASIPGTNDILIPSTSGFIMVDSTNGSSSALVLPPVDCSSIGFPPSPDGQPTPTSISCQDRPVEFTVDQSGNIWYESDFGSGMAEIPSGTF